MVTSLVKCNSVAPYNNNKVSISMIRSFYLLLVGLIMSLPAQAGWIEVIAGGDVREVKKLIVAGENVNARLDGDKTPLMVAAKSGNIYVVNALLAAGAEINAKTGSGETALVEAVRAPNMDVAVRLIAAGADTTGVEIVRSNSKTSPVVIDVEDMKLEKSAFAYAATRAFVQRGWFVSQREPDRIVGMTARRIGGVSEVQLFRVEILLAHPYIVIQCQENHCGMKRTWLQNLEQDVQVELETSKTRM